MARSTFSLTKDFEKALSARDPEEMSLFFSNLKEIYASIPLEERYKNLLEAHSVLIGNNPATLDRHVEILCQSEILPHKHQYLMAQMAATADDLPWQRVGDPTVDRYRQEIREHDNDELLQEALFHCAANHVKEVKKLTSGPTPQRPN